MAYSGSSYVIVSEGSLDWDLTWHKVLDINFDDVNSGGETAADQYGVHLWLLRAKVTSGEWQVYIKWGYEGIAATKMVQGEVMEIDATDWDIYEAGAAQWPLYDAQAVDFSDSFTTLNLEYEVEIWAQRISGTGDLYLDCLVLIPIGEAFIYVEGMDWSDSSQEYTGIFTSPRDRITTLSYDPDGNDVITARPVPSKYNWGLPPGDCRMIICYARASSHDVDDVIEISQEAGEAGYRPRWLLVRGSD